MKLVTTVTKGGMIAYHLQTSTVHEEGEQSQLTFSLKRSTHHYTGTLHPSRTCLVILEPERVSMSECKCATMVGKWCTRLGVFFWDLIQAGSIALYSHRLSA
jgi:hypothetical protein